MSMMAAESREEYCDWELGRAADRLIDEIMLVQPGETVVITGDSYTDRRVTRATARAVFAKGAQPVVVTYPAVPEVCSDPPAPVGAALAAADVWIEFAGRYILYSNAFVKAMEAGARYICLTGLDADIMVRTIGSVNFPVMVELGDTIVDLLGKSKEVVITNEAGTDFTCTMDDLIVLRQTGTQAEAGQSTMLGGQVVWVPQLENMYGTLVFHAIWPPTELGLLHEPIALDIEKGIVTAVRGGSEARTLEAWLDSFGHPMMEAVAHYSAGFNPGVTALSGNIVEDERVFGCVEFGIGRGRDGAPSHTDGIVINPSIYVDGVAIEENGVYVEEKLAKLSRELGVRGY